MKSVTIVAFVILYLVAATGINGSAHYCAGRLASVSFGWKPAKNCACGSENTKSDCCQDKNFSISFNDDHQKSQQAYIDFSGPADRQSAKPTSYYFPLFTSSCGRTDTFSFHQPPERKQLPLYLLNRVIRI